jgi:hypothetical protein
MITKLCLFLFLFLFLSTIFADLCTPHTGTDYVCCDISHQTVSDTTACCNLCESNPQCQFWKLDINDPNKYCYLKAGIPSNPTPCPSCVVGMKDAPPPPPPPAPKHLVFTCPSLLVYNDSSYDLSPENSSSSSSSNIWFSNGDIIVLLEHQFYSASSNTLVITQLGPEKNGIDTFGSYTSYSISLQAKNGTADGSTINALFACYSSGLIAFNLTLPPDGKGSAQGPATGNLITHFPSFVSNGILGEQLGWLLNGGIWTLFEFWGVGTNNGYQGSDGPAWFYNTSFYPSTSAVVNITNTKTSTVLFSALDHFKSTLVGVYPDPFFNLHRLSWGLQGSASIIPGGYKTSIGFYSGLGISETTYDWGNIMTNAYQTTRLPLSRDVLNSKLSYWSDNGAVYFQSYWDDVCKRNCTAGVNDAETLFTALKQHHVDSHLPFSIYQLDTWWFYQQADVLPTGDLDCIDWTPRKDLFPNGLLPLTQRNIPLLLYAWGFVQVGQGQKMLNFTWINGPNNEAIVSLNETYLFYSMIRDRFLTFNGTSFEQDNMGSISGWPEISSSAIAHEQWWYDFATPWCTDEIPVQICESTASDLLESLKYNCITSTRDQIDDVPGSHQSHGPNEDLFLIRWHVGFDRLLIGALKLKPFFDNVWSTSSMPGPPWYNNYENYTELAVALSVLGGGAVGIADEIGYENRTLIIATAMEDGTLLSPSRPSHYIDAMYLPKGSQPFPVDIGRIFQAPSIINDSIFSTILAIDVPTSFMLRPNMLAPDLSLNGSNYLAVKWSPGFTAIDTACSDLMPLTNCAVSFSTDSPIDLYTGIPPVNYTHYHEIWSLAPLFFNGYSLLGELGKFVRVSSTRFSNISTTSTSLTFYVTGATNETVKIAVAAPPSSTSGVAQVRRISVIFEIQGIQKVTCENSNGNNACALMK